MGIHPRTREEASFDDYWHLKGAIAGEDGEKELDHHERARATGYRHVRKPHGDAREVHPKEYIEEPIVREARQFKPSKDEPVIDSGDESTQMTYDEYRLWKHNQRRAKKEPKVEKSASKQKKQPKKPKVEEEEPDFETYAEY